MRQQGISSPQIVWAWESGTAPSSAKSKPYPKGERNYLREFNRRIFRKPHREPIQILKVLEALLPLTQKREDVAALNTDVVRRFFVRPIEVEEGGSPCVEKRVALMKLLASAKSARERSLADLHFNGLVGPLDLLKVHPRRSPRSM